jgi:hypothetical protein
VSVPKLAALTSLKALSLRGFFAQANELNSLPGSLQSLQFQRFLAPVLQDSHLLSLTRLSQLRALEIGCTSALEPLHLLAIERLTQLQWLNLTESQALPQTLRYAYARLHSLLRKTKSNLVWPSPVPDQQLIVTTTPIPGITSLDFV